MKLSTAFLPPSFHHILTATRDIVNKPVQHARSLANELERKTANLNKTKKHTMLALICLFAFLAVGTISGAASLRRDDDGAPAPAPADPEKAASSRYSTAMVFSIIAREQGIMLNDTTPGSALQSGIVQKAFAAYIDYYGVNDQIQEYIDRSAAAVATYMANTIDDIKDWPLDRFSNANAMLAAGGDQNPAYAHALDALRDSLRVNPRNEKDGLWYWESYPEWSYLDGMYSLGPFVALDSRQGRQGNSSSSGGNATTLGSGGAAAAAGALDDMRLQFRLLWEHCYNGTTGLLVHGYDASRRASWAGRATGASGVVWGRSLGWFAMALVDTLELLYGRGTPGAGGEPLLAMYQRLVPAVVGHADRKSGGWYQVVDMPRRGGNYVESSATAMLAYALLKGARLGYLDPSDLSAAREAGRAAYGLLAREFVTREEGGVLCWGGTVGVCSLNSSATYDVRFRPPSRSLFPPLLPNHLPLLRPRDCFLADICTFPFAVLRDAAHRSQQRPRLRGLHPGLARGREPQRQPL